MHMRVPLIISAAVVMLLSACGKDKYTTEPQIKFKDIDPQYATTDLTSLNKDQAPKVTLEVTDEEGDLGFIANKDTAKVFVKNLLTSGIDSFNFPDLQTSAGKRFKADVVINLFNSLERTPGPVPHTDTIYFEIYVTDFAKNKSNVIVTDKPVYYTNL